MTKRSRKAKKRDRQTKSAKRSRGSAQQTRRRLLHAVFLALLVGSVAVVWLLLGDTKPDFSGDRALEEVVRQVELGPRAPGTEGHRRTRAYLVETLQQYAKRVGVQSFPYVDRHDSTRTVEGSNIMASFNLDPKVNKRVMLAAHWDTRPTADQDPDSTNWTSPVPGANDGSSGVAVLLEMARLLHADPPNVGVDLVLFDLEDMGDDISADADSTVTGNPFAIGSEYFAENNEGYRPSYGILLDMVCDKNLRIPKEGYSVAYARPIVDKVWAAAARVGATAFVEERGQAVMDDHVPFLKRGIRVIDLIQTPFPRYWHTLDDTPDKCSAASLQQVGDVLVEVIYSE